MLQTVKFDLTGMLTLTLAPHTVGPPRWRKTAVGSSLQGPPIRLQEPEDQPITIRHSRRSLSQGKVCFTSPHLLFGVRG